MKKIFLIVLLIGSLPIFAQTIQERKRILIHAISYRESHDGKYTWNPKDSSAGKFGIRWIMIEEVDQIVGYRKYELRDRLDDKKAEEIFITYQNFVNPKWYFENGCRAWNGGRGWRNKIHTTDNYWKVILADGIIK
jgi:hypothetical protein